MVVVPLQAGTEEMTVKTTSGGENSNQWIRYAAAGTLAASGALFVTGFRKAGLAAAVSGVALAMLDQQDEVRKWWNAVPGFLEDIQTLLSKAQDAVEDVTEQSQKLRQAIGS